MKHLILVVDDRDRIEKLSIKTAKHIIQELDDERFDLTTIGQVFYPETRSVNPTDKIPNILMRADKQVEWVENFVRAPIEFDTILYTRSVHIVYAFRVMIKEGKFDHKNLIQVTLKTSDNEVGFDVIVSTYDKDGRAPDSSNYASHTMQTYGELLGRLL